MGSVVNIVPGRLIPADRIIFRIGRRQPHKKPPVSEIVAESPHYVLLIDIDININPAGDVSSGHIFKTLRDVFKSAGVFALACPRKKEINVYAKFAQRIAQPIHIKVVDDRPAYGVGGVFKKSFRVA